MPKITFLGAGSSIFARNVLGDCMLSPALESAEMALYDIDPIRLKQSESILKTLSANLGGKARVVAYDDPRAALANANYVVNAIAVGPYDPTILADFEIPLKYGLIQTVADTLGIGGIFRALRTIPVMLDYARLIEEVCPNAWLLNYTNPMASVTGAILHGLNVKAVGLCHSVQVCAKELLKPFGINTDNVRARIAGINHQAWLLELEKDGVDIYPEIKAKALARTEKHGDMVRCEIMKTFGYYVTESSTHAAEYLPYFIKSRYPELMEQFSINTGMYKEWGPNREKYWKQYMQEQLENKKQTHVRTFEYASYIMEAIETNRTYEIAGNVLNTGGLIANLPREATVEVPCLVNANGITPCYVGSLPPQCAAINRTNINTQLLTIEAALTGKREHLYHAALLDPHTSAELSIADTISMCDELIEAHQQWLPILK
jgi:alpha-galactosidase